MTSQKSIKWPKWRNSDTALQMLLLCSWLSNLKYYVDENHNHDDSSSNAFTCSHSNNDYDKSDNDNGDDDKNKNKDKEEQEKQDWWNNMIKMIMIMMKTRRRVRRSRSGDEWCVWVKGDDDTNLLALSLTNGWCVCTFVTTGPLNVDLGAFFRKEHKIYLYFFTLIRQRLLKSLRQAGIYLFCMVSIMDADVLVTQGARSAATMKWIYSNQDNSVPAH